MKDPELYIENLWKKYELGKPSQKIVRSILDKAQRNFKKGEEKSKLGTYVSWWARQAANKLGTQKKRVEK